MKSLLKSVNNLSYNAAVAKDYSREIHYDPDKKERIKELELIIKEMNGITECYFSQIINNVNEVKIQAINRAEASLSEDSEDSESDGGVCKSPLSEDSESDGGVCKSPLSEDSQSKDSQAKVKVSK